jgi:hypothetical protein
VNAVELAELREQIAAARERFQPIAVPWPDGWQCLQTAVAECLRLPPSRVPARLDLEDITEWDARVAEKLGVRMESFGLDEPPPKEPWIAVVDSGEYPHAVACIGNDHRARGRIAGYRLVPV